MQAVASAFVTNPALSLAIGVMIGALLVLVVQRVRAIERKDANPLEGLFQNDELSEQMETIAERRDFAHRSGAVLRARVDHLPQVGQLWGQETRSNAIAQVAQVMRAGVRKGDAVRASGLGADAESVEGTIEIHASEVNEAEACTIARRLLNSLSHMPVPGMGRSMRVSASIGVAECRPGESEEAIRARAEVALAAAQAAGEDHVMTASEWEEVKLLPAPEPSPAQNSPAKSERAA